MMSTILKLILCSIGTLVPHWIKTGANTSSDWFYIKSLFLAPVKKIIRIKVRTEPWINADILKAIKKINGLFN